MKLLNLFITCLTGCLCFLFVILLAGTDVLLPFKGGFNIQTMACAVVAIIPALSVFLFPSLTNWCIFISIPLYFCTFPWSAPYFKGGDGTFAGLSVIFIVPKYCITQCLAVYFAEYLKKLLLKQQKEKNNEK